MSRVAGASTLRRAFATGLLRTGGVRLLALAARHLALGPGRRVRRAPPTFPVLAFHRVNDARDPFFPSVPTEVFEQRIAYLARAYRVLPVEELVERARRHALPRNAIALTFDDGYRDTLTHAAPILAKHGVPATVFLATGFIGSAAVPWVDRLALALKTTRAASCQAPSGDRLRLASVGERLRALDRLLDTLKRVPDEDMRRMLDGLLEALDALDAVDPKGFKDLMLSWDDVHALRGLGFTIGAHTVNHPILSRVSRKRAWDEIRGSRAMIESACGEAPRAFAYPNGRPEDYTESVVRLVQEAGFTCAVTTRFGVNGPATPPYELRRGGPWEEHLPSFALKLAWYRMSLA
jgi:peptidoglycan/xylan/chitin deacetylase (PgdA/CDA1 family)